MHEKVKREVKVLKMLDAHPHPHICKLYSILDTRSDIFLVMELAQGGDLFDKISTHGKVSIPL